LSPGTREEIRVRAKMAGGWRFTRHKALDFRAGVVDEVSGHCLRHDEITLLGERLLLLLIERDGLFASQTHFRSLTTRAGMSRF
jgi:hypothetical protein